MDLRIGNSGYLKTIKHVRFFHFCVVYNTNNFTLKFCMYDFQFCKNKRLHIARLGASASICGFPVGDHMPI
jgi:hypothetical protein